MTDRESVGKMWMGKGKGREGSSERSSSCNNTRQVLQSYLYNNERVTIWGCSFQYMRSKRMGLDAEHERGESARSRRSLVGATRTVQRRCV